jgi:HPt (histidine-containing phosphotransfer) domain-containing protein
LRAGCTDYLTKPIQRHLLIETARKYLPAAAQGGAATGLRSEYEEDPAMVDLVKAFVSELPGRVEKIRSLLADGDLEQLRCAVHQLKGAGGGYGYPEITRLAAEAERTMDTHAEIAQIEERVRQLVETIGRVEGYQPQGDR